MKTFERVCGPLKTRGVRVTLIGIRPVSQDYNQSRELVHEADETVRLDRDRLAAVFSLIPVPPAQSTSQLSSAQPLSQDPARDFAAQWLARATAAETAVLKAERPRIPKTLDVELLRFAEQSLGVDLRGQDEQHRSLRRAFWTAIDAAPTS
jgi:hypothetical protein